MTNKLIRVLAPLPMLAALFAPAACGSAAAAPCGGSSATAVTVLGPWTGTEADDFNKVLCKFTQTTGIPTVYQGTRALDQVLQADISKGTPPDVAVLPSAGALRQYADKGLVPLDADLAGTDSYRPLWQQLTSVNGHRYAVVVKAALKSLVWYDPKAVQQFWHAAMPTTWAQLTALAGTISAHGRAPWCIGTGSTSESGWPGTDWIEDIVLHEYGTGVYQDWADGRLSWTDPRIEQAWRQWAALLAGVPGGATSALFTDSGDTGPMMYQQPPACYLNHEAFIGFYQKFKVSPTPQPGTDFNYFPFPSMGAPGAPGAEVGADLAGAFGHDDGTRALIRFLATTTGQAVWPQLPGTGVTTIDPNVPRSLYPNAITRGIAATLTGTGILCFDASDLMPPTLSGAFEQAVLAVLGDPTRYLDQPGGLDDLMRGLDAASTVAYAGKPSAFACGQ